METVTVHTEKDIVFGLIHGQYDLTQLDNEFIVFCEVLLEIQIYVFNEMFEGKDMTSDVAYSGDATFKGNEHDLLICANNAKIIHPVLKQVKEEISHRDIDHPTMHKDAILTYAKIQGIDMQNTQLL
jgi:hypothetical protein